MDVYKTLLVCVKTIGTKQNIPVLTMLIEKCYFEPKSGALNK